MRRHARTDQEGRSLLLGTNCALTVPRGIFTRKILSTTSTMFMHLGWAGRIRKRLVKTRKWLHLFGKHFMVSAMFGLITGGTF